MAKQFNPHKYGKLWSTVDRVLETMLDMQNMYKKAQRLGMLDEGTGTWRG